MTPEELRRDEAARWLTTAEKDLTAAELLASAVPSRSVFHSQQAAEKAAKGFLTFHNVPFRKVHDLKELGAQCAAVDPLLASLMQDAAGLSDYAVAFRYLDAPYEPDASEAAEALGIARRVCERLRTLLRSLPKA